MCIRDRYLDDPKLSKKDYLECKKLIEDAKRQITKAPGIKAVSYTHLLGSLLIGIASGVFPLPQVYNTIGLVL